MKRELDLHRGLPLDNEVIYGVDSLDQDVNTSSLSSEIDPTSLLTAGISKSLQPAVESNFDSWRQHMESRGEEHSTRSQELRERVRIHMEILGYKPNRTS